MSEKYIIVRGGGDLATGVIHRLYQCGYKILILESEKPSAIRRNVAFCEAVYDGTALVEGVCCSRIHKIEQCRQAWAKNQIPLLVDPYAACLDSGLDGQGPEALIDGIIAKKNLGTRKDMAPVTIGLGPGFQAGSDVDYVIETMRGHDLGRIIRDGYALPNTGAPGVIGGVSKERVIHSPAAGVIHVKSQIADLVEKGQILAYVEDVPVPATITGVLRGIIREGYQIFQGMKIADIDPRKEQKKNCFTISDKARCIAGSVVEILLKEHILP